MANVGIKNTAIKYLDGEKTIATNLVAADQKAICSNNTCRSTLDCSGICS